MSPSASSSAVNGTPTRDRLPFPPTAQTSPAPVQRSTTQSSSINPSTSSTGQSPVATSSTITTEALLRTHASSPDQKLAALEQAVSERNVLSSQNAQLWKLIEKQRTGYTQILKELERVRSERDNYKVKLGVLSGGQNGRNDPSQRGKERIDRSTSNEPPASRASESSASDRGQVLHARDPASQHESDNQRESSGPLLRNQFHF